MTPWEILQAIMKARTESGAELEREYGPGWKDQAVNEQTGGQIKTYAELLTAANEDTSRERKAADVHSIRTQQEEVNPYLGMAKKFTHEASLGVGPRLGAFAAEHIPGGMTGDEYMAASQGMDERFAEDSPVLNTLSGLAGGVAGGIAMGGGVTSGAARLARGAGAASKTARAARAARTALARPTGMLAAGTAGGALEGGIQGAAEAEEGERWEGMKQGAGMGALTGGVFAPLGMAGGALLRRFAPTGEEAVERGVRSAAAGERKTAPEMVEELQGRYDEMPMAEQRATAMAELDPALMNRLQSETTVEAGGAAARRVRGDYPLDVEVETMRRATGMNQEEIDQMTGALDTARRLASAGFEGVGTMPVTSQLAGVFDEMPGVRRVYKSIQRQAAEAGQTLPDIVEGAEIPFTAMDEVRRILDARLTAAYRPTGANLSVPARRSQRDAFREAFDDAFKNAPNVRSDFKIAIRAQQAFDEGMDAMKINAREVEDLVRQMSDDQLRAYRAGFAQNLIDEAASKGNPATFLRTQKNRDLIDIILGSDQLDEFMRGAERSATRKRRYNIMEGSQTAARQQGLDVPKNLYGATVGLPEFLMRPSRARRATELMGTPGATQDALDAMGQRVGTGAPMTSLLGPRANPREALREGIREGMLLGPLGGASGIRSLLRPSWEKWEEERQP